MNLFQALIRIIFPDLCFACRELIAPGEVLCLACLATIKPIASKLLPLHERKELHVYALGAYQDALHKLVVAKFHRNIATANAMGRLMAKCMPPEIFDVDYVVPVPLHWWRYASRGYNQAVEMAKAISKERNVAYRPLLMRRRFTQFQYLLSQKERKENVNDVFVIRPDAQDIRPGCRILLIDDLCTSGATLQAAANKLLVFKPINISAAVCARALS